MKTRRSQHYSIILIILISVSSMGQQKEVVGYFPSWNWQHKNSLMTYDKIPFKKLTIIDYAFWHPLLDGTIAGINPASDSLILYGRIGKPSLVPLAHENKVKVMLSIGGWDDSQNFPAVASTGLLRTIRRPRIPASRYSTRRHSSCKLLPFSMPSSRPPKEILL